MSTFSFIDPKIIYPDSKTNPIEKVIFAMAPEDNDDVSAFYKDFTPEDLYDLYLKGKLAFRSPADEYICLPIQGFYNTSSEQAHFIIMHDSDVVISVDAITLRDDNEDPSRILVPCSITYTEV